MANATSVAVIGSELGVLELAVEDDLGMRKAKRMPARKKTTAKRKAVKKAKTAAKKPAVKRGKAVAKRKPAKAKRSAKRRGR